MGRRIGRPKDGWVNVMHGRDSKQRIPIKYVATPTGGEKTRKPCRVCGQMHNSLQHGERPLSLHKNDLKARIHHGFIKIEQ